MKNYTIIFILILFLFLNCGKNSISVEDIYSVKGILYQDQIIDNTHWDISLDWISDDIIIQCKVRLGPGYMWEIPQKWYISDGYIRIYNNLYSQYEYKITGLSP